MKKRKSQKHIIYHVIDSILPALLVLLGSFTTGSAITFESVLIAVMASGIVAVNKFSEWWKSDDAQNEFTSNIFNFIG
jgi:hypothetical protein